MLSTLLLCSGLIGAATPEGAVRGRYDVARAEAGRDADKHVKLALWCEEHGLAAERLRHLALAVLNDPRNATARGLLGLVDFGGRWQTPDAVSARLQEDAAHKATFADYAARRARTPGSADAQWKLALWCEQNGLKAESKAHCAAVLRRDPSHEGARRRLGYKKHGQRWVTEAQLDAERAEAEARKKADKHWRPLLTKWRDALGDKAKHAAADDALAQVTDPRAAPSVWDLFARGDEAQQAKAVQLFGQIEGPAASQALATLAVAGSSALVRRRATETLRSRDPREFLGLLVGMIRDPIPYELRPGQTPGQVGALRIGGKHADLQRVYQVNQNNIERLLAWMPVRLFGSAVPFDPYSAQNLWMASNPSGVLTGGLATPVGNAEVAAARRDLRIAAQLNRIEEDVNQVRRQLANDVATLEAANSSVQAVNGATLPVLKVVTGQDLGESVDAWRGWWSDQRGLVYEPPPADKPVFTQIISAEPIHHSCFGAGTAVRTLDGSRSIESIRAGDQVLTQDVHTGKLAFEPVIAIYHNKPAATLKVTLGREAVVATGIHRFWKAGHGWVMARELKAGDPVRTLSGVVKVAAVDDAPVQPVFNLEVASDQTYFVGAQGALVHDNSLTAPVTAPFDAAPELTATAAASR